MSGRRRKQLTREFKERYNRVAHGGETRRRTQVGVTVEVVYLPSEQRRLKKLYLRGRREGKEWWEVR